jgi:hypothetical protein
MTARELFEEVRALGGGLWMHAPDLVLRPPELATPELVARLKPHKGALLGMLATGAVTYRQTCDWRGCAIVEPPAGFHEWAAGIGFARAGVIRTGDGEYLALADTWELMRGGDGPREVHVLPVILLREEVTA